MAPDKRTDDQRSRWVRDADDLRGAVLGDFKQR